MTSPALIGGAGFAMMAWKEARRRAGVPMLPLCFKPDRAHARNVGKSSWHYYRIIDDAWAAWFNEQLGSVMASNIPLTVKL